MGISVSLSWSSTGGELANADDDCVGSLVVLARAGGDDLLTVHPVNLCDVFASMRYLDLQMLLKEDDCPLACEPALQLDREL